VSDLLEAAAAALGTPSALVQRAAAARAAADGASTEDILTAWSGGAPSPRPTQAPQPVDDPAPEAAAEPSPSPVAVLDPPPLIDPTPIPVILEEAVEEDLEPVALSARVKTAVRVGAWTGAALGVIAFLVAASFWAPDAVLGEDGRPTVLATPRGTLIGAALVSILFGALVASLSRAAASWHNPSMQLTSSRSSTGWIGAATGLVLGVAAGAVMAGLGTPIEGSEPEIVQLPVLATFAVMLIGGAILGGLTAAIPQFFGTPVAVDDTDHDEVAEVRGRIGHAVTIPLAAVLLLALLVLPFAFTLLEANHLVANGGALIAIVTAGGILGFAALAGSKPNMRVTFGEVMVALLGIGTVVAIILSVLAFRH
jgi:hypothetical protein